MNSRTEDVRSFWNGRAGLGQWAGTRDVLAKQLEIEAIAARVRDGMRVLDVGCGNGITAIELARRYDIEVTGIDFAEEMVAAAAKLSAGAVLRGRVDFKVGDVRDLGGAHRPFDLAYTERTLINLQDWPTQAAAIQQIAGRVRAGGVYVMCENSQDGLDEINELRQRVNLPIIEAPWHNRYLRDLELELLRVPGLRLESIDYYSSLYYLLSRVVNAWLAARDGHEPEYDSPINQLALALPSIGRVGQGRIWLWKKDAT